MSPETGRGRVPPSAWGYFARSFLPADVVSRIWVTWSMRIVQRGERKTLIWGMETGISSEDHPPPSGHCVIPVFVPSKTFSWNKTRHSAHLVPSKTFSWNKTPHKVHLVPLKTFSRNQIAGLGGAYYLHIGLHTISRRKSEAW